MTATDAFERLIQHEVACVHPEVRSWLAPAEIESAWRAALDSQATRMRDDAWAREFRHEVPVSGTTVADYKPRITAGAASPTALAGIAFRTREPEGRFVDVAALDGPLESAAALESLIERLLQEFEGFAPQRVRIFRWSHQWFDVACVPGADWDHRFLAAPARAILCRAPAQGADRVRLEVADDLSRYPEYTEIYARVHEARPHLASQVRPHRAEDLDRCRADGLVCWIWIDGEWAGCIASAPASRQGVRGHLLLEEVIAPRFWGQGLAPVVQRDFVEHLGASADTVIFGTIAAANAPALRTALRLGRQDLGGRVFLPSPAVVSGGSPMDPG